MAAWILRRNQYCFIWIYSGYSVCSLPKLNICRFWRHFLLFFVSGGIPLLVVVFRSLPELLGSFAHFWSHVVWVWTFNVCLSERVASLQEVRDSPFICASSAAIGLACSHFPLNYINILLMFYLYDISFENKEVEEEYSGCWFVWN